MSLINSTAIPSASGAYEIDNSLKLEADNSERLKSNNTHASSTPTSSKIGTFSFWVKRTELGANYMIVSGNSARYSRMFFNSSDQIQLYSGDSSWNSVQPITNAVFRDTSAWYHIVLRLDSTDSTAANRLRLYVNGEEQTWSTSPNITQDGVLTLCQFGSPTWHSWGSNLSYFSPSAYFSGYLAEVHYVDGQALAPTEFGETDSDSGIWKPKEYDGTYGNSGYYMDFEDASNLGDDESGNGFDFDENNITAADQATDSPTNNFATINILHAQTSNSTYTEGATYAVNGQIQGWQPYIPTIAVTSGKWYFETQGGGPDMYLQTGMGDEGDLLEWGIDQKYYGRSGSKSVAYYGGTGGNGLIYPAQTNPSPAVQYGSSDIIGCAVDIDNGYVYWHKNGTYINGGVPTSGSTGTGGTAIPTGGNSNGTYYLGAATYANSNMKFNYGGYTTISISSAATDGKYGKFEYAPPTDFYALCSQRLAEFGGTA
jgi:hypothetical protein